MIVDPLDEIQKAREEFEVFCSQLEKRLTPQLRAADTKTILELLSKMLKALRRVKQFISLYSKPLEASKPLLSQTQVDEIIEHASEFMETLFTFQVMHHDDLNSVYMEMTPETISSFRFTTVMRGLCVGRMFFACIISELQGDLTNQRLRALLDDLQKKLKSKFQGFSTLLNYEKLHEPEFYQDLLWTLLHFSTLVEVTSPEMDLIMEAASYHRPNLVRHLGVKQEKMEWSYKNLSIKSNLGLEEVAVILYNWERAISLIRYKLQSYQANVQKMLKPDLASNEEQPIKWIFRNYIQTHYQFDWDKQMCAQKCEDLWKEITKRLSLGRMMNAQKQEYQKMVFELLSAPGLHQGYYDLFPGVEHAIAPAERMLDANIHRLAAFFCAAPLEKIAAGFLDETVVMYKAEAGTISPVLPAGVPHDGYLYSKICILIVIMQLEKMITNANIVPGGFMQTYFLRNPDADTLFTQPCRIVLYGNTFHFTNSKAELIRISGDHPAAFAFCYMNELRLLGNRMGLFVSNQFKKFLQ